jgi:phosphoglycerate dehydrogenase-like enzyme
MSQFRVALSGDFRTESGAPRYPSFDLSPLSNDPNIDMRFVDAADGRITADSMADTDALILLVPRFDGESLPADERLSIVTRFGVGYDNVDVNAMTEAGLPAVITPDGVRRPVAVSVITFILALSQKLLVKDRLCREGVPGWGRKADHMGEGLVGKTLGQLGIGNIGAEVFRLARPFGLRFIAHDPYADPNLAADLGVDLVSMDDLFRQSDFLSVSVPLTEETHHVVNAERLAMMKATAYVINTARGPVIDQKALYDALAGGELAGAGLDVFETEPCPADEPLLSLDTVIATPHALCWTDECFAGIGAACVKAVTDVMHGRVPTGIVNHAVADDPRFLTRLDNYRARFA